MNRGHCGRGVLQLLGLAVAAWSCAPATMAAQGTSGCRPADTHKVPAHLDYLKAIVSATDSLGGVYRTTFQLQQVSATKVTLVTKAATCASAAAAINAVRGEPGVVRQVWVYSLGSNYAAEDPTITTETQGDYPIYLFSGTWVAKPILMY